ncbi:MAG: translation initiation factor IF-3 [Candidatus Omnitrophica bacterium]|nr:translation initiation factor IF-3 [Candidatus Omnitrophota bacterium]MCK4423137.1 translation initiation factor IF-3 [Candidatus Omnitrophota bacterium]
MNEGIRISQIRLIGEEGQQLGVVAPQDGIKLAKEAGLDLVEVAPEAKPPVCRIMDYTKYRYDQARKSREARKKQRVVHLKEIRIKPNIEEHDYQVKLRHAREFLEKKDKVKVVLRFRGREITHKELGSRLLERLIEDVKDMAETEKPPVSEGRSVTMVLVPR